MSNTLFYLAAFLGVIGILIAFHELGHYCVARWCGVKVLQFSLGFGKTLWSRRFGPDQTEWRVSLFPLGGYVRMLDEREGAVAAKELHRAFNRQGVWRRVAIVAAGPLANFLLAVVVYWGLFVSGVEALRPVLGEPPAATQAAQAGIVDGERVQRVGSVAIETYQELRWQILQHAVDHESVLLETINAQNEIALRRLDLRHLRDGGFEGDALNDLGLTLHRPKVAPVVGRVAPGSPAEQAGMQAGDTVLAINGAPITQWAMLVQQVRAAAGQPLSVEVLRQGQSLSLRITPEAHEERGQQMGRIGVSVQDSGGARQLMMTEVRYGVFEAVGRALDETWSQTVFSLAMMKKMVLGEVSWRNLSGPVTIADYAGQSARMGLEAYLKFMALVSISLGVLNLLPVPLLDGGHLLYYAIEIVRRRPVSERAMEIGQRVGIALLLTLMTFAFVNDINRLIAG